MSRSEVRLLPGAFGDPFRAIEILPGVVPTVSGLPYYYVRGAPPAAVGYFVDEVRVPYLFHFGLGPGVIHPALIEEVTLHPAAYPARFGRFAGGVVAGETKSPADEPTGEALIRLYDAGAFVEAPFAGGRGHAAIGGRYSYTALILSLLLPDTTISYRDYNGRFDYQLTDRLRFTAFTFGAYDYASDRPNGTERVVFASEFHRLDLRLDHEGDAGSHSRIAATFGLDRTRLEGSRFARDYVLGLRGRHRAEVTRSWEIEIGADLMLDLYGGDLPSALAVSRDAYASAVALYSPRTDTTSGAWISTRLVPMKRLEITMTARADVFTSAGQVALGPSPRTTVRVPLHDRIAAVFAMGVAPQAPAFAIPLPAVGYRGLPAGLSYAYQKSAGVEMPLPLSFVGTLVGFHHSYFNLRDVFQTRDDVDLDKPQTAAKAPSQAYGVELLLRRKLVRRVSATVSYTLSRSQLGSTQALPAMTNLFDRTHVFQAASAVDLGRGWFASLRSVIYSGWPEAQDVALGRPASRLPTFFRFDGRVEKKWAWGPDGHISMLLEGLNVTGSKEILSQKCSTERGCEPQAFGPIIVPSIGVEGAR